MNHVQDRMTEGSIAGKIIRFAVPLFKGNVRVYRALHLIMLPRTVVARYCNTRARRDAGEKADEQENERARGADGGKRVVAEHIADYERVRGVIELLK